MAEFFQKTDLIDLVIKISGFARRFEKSDFFSCLNTFLQDLQVYMHQNSKDSEKIRRIGYSVETVLLLQRSEDFIAIADIFEFELSKLL